MQTSTYLWPGTVHFGFGAAGLVGQESQARGATSAFIIVDPGVMKAGLLDVVLDSLYAVNVIFSIYDKVVPNPDVESVQLAAKAYRESKAHILIGVGGGSALDMAKAVKLMVGGPASATVWDYATRLGDDRRPYPPASKMPTTIAIPTTAGTGAEVTPWAVITRGEDQLKFGVGDATTFPDVALVDPTLTLTLPPFLTAATGMDALSHLIEAYVSTNHNPLLDPMIVYGIELVARSLRPAVAHGNNPQARADMMQASLIGGIAISSKWLGACHSLAHPLSGLAGVHHGLACGLMLPHQMAYSLPGALARYAAVADALRGESVKGGVRERALAAVTAVTDLLQDIALPTRLRDVGVTEDLIPALAKAAITDLNWWTNPRTVSEEVMAALYEAAL